MPYTCTKTELAAIVICWVQVLVDKHHRYALSPTQLFWACWSRENVLVSRNLFQYGFRFFVTMFMVRPAFR